MKMAGKTSVFAAAVLIYTLLPSPTALRAQTTSGATPGGVSAGADAAAGQTYITDLWLAADDNVTTENSVVTRWNNKVAAN
jgi:hypothetical protein